MLLTCGVREDSWGSLGQQGDPSSQDWCWSWNSNTLATWCEELTPWKRPWCWERLQVGGEGDVRGWEGWMASPTQWTWIWISSGSWWCTGRPGVLQSMGSQTVWHNERLNWTEHINVNEFKIFIFSKASQTQSIHYIIPFIWNSKEFKLNLKWLKSKQYLPIVCRINWK